MSNQTFRTALVMYRYKENGLEVFLLNPDENDASWGVPAEGTSSEEIKKIMEKYLSEKGMKSNSDVIELDPVTCTEKGETIKAWAVEGTNQQRVRLRDQGAFLLIKEAIKKVFPNQVAMLKELHEILSSRNVVRNL